MAKRLKKNKAPPRPYASMRGRILANIKRVPAPSWAEVQGPCWEWQGAKNARGYGKLSVRKPWRGPNPYTVLVHRLVLEVFCGIPMSEIECSMHYCSNKLCCNPDHLEKGTAQQNRDHYYEVERFQSAAPLPRCPADDFADWI